MQTVQQLQCMFFWAPGSVTNMWLGTAADKLPALMADSTLYEAHIHVRAACFACLGNTLILECALIQEQQIASHNSLLTRSQCQHTDSCVART